MASNQSFVSFDEGRSITRPPLFKRVSYFQWCHQMEFFIKAFNFDLWEIIEEVFVEGPKKKKNMSSKDMGKVKLNAKAMHTLLCGLNDDVFKKVSYCKSAKEMWEKLEKLYKKEDVKGAKESPASSIFKSLEGLEELYGTSSLERAEHEQTFVDPIITCESLECSESFDEIMHDESVSEFMSTDTNENNNLWKIAVDHDIYKNLREFEAVQRPSTDYMETVQRDINAEMRASLIDGLVRATENKRILLPPDTLCMAVNYIDRYLSSISIDRQQLQLLGLACMLIAYKHESVKSAIPKVIVLCNITGKTYHKAKILQMESAVLNHLNFEMSVPTAYYFLAQFICAAKTSNQDHPLQWECLSSYILELSLVEYSMLQYAQPLIAASAAFLARFILSPLEKPWDSKLRGYTLYQPSDLVECVMALHCLYRTGGGPNSTAIRSKYSQSKVS
ncbi:hypothetical protein GQ457_14G003120 [Hibiscus cannabinus]